MPLDIYLRNLGKETQDKALAVLGLLSAEDGNLDVFPLFVLEEPEPEADEPV